MYGKSHDSNLFKTFAKHFLLIFGIFVFCFPQEVKSAPLSVSNVTFNADSSARIKRPDSVVQAPSTILNPTQGWVAIRVKMGFNATDSFGSDPVMWDLSESDPNDLFVYYNVSNDTFHFLRRRNRTGPTIESGLQTFHTGDYKTIIAAWDITHVKLSVDGAPFVIATSTLIPAQSPFYIGSSLVQGTGREPNSDYYWVAGGTGTLTNADAATIHSYGNTDRTRSNFPGQAAFIWWANDNQYNNDGGGTPPTPTPTSFNTSTPRPTVTPTQPSNTTPTNTPIITQPSGNAPLRIDAGSTSSYIDTIGNVWLSDAGFSGGTTVNRGTISIANTSDPQIYRTERYGMNSYDLNVPNGNYTARLHFAETSGSISTSGQRIFSVSMEGATVLQNLDVLSEAGGKNTALVKSANVSVNDGQLNIGFVRNIENPQINGIEVIPESRGQAPPGDGNGDGKVDGADYIMWVSHYGQLANGVINGDFNNNGKVDGIDYVIWLSNYGQSNSPTILPPQNATSIPTPRPAAQTPTPTLAITAGSTPTNPPIAQIKGIWISQDELLRLPTSGAAWDRVVSAANSSWGSACLDNIDCPTDVKVLAGALVAARTGDSTMRSKVISGLQSAMNSPLSRALELARGLQSYVIAADIIGYRTTAFEGWVRNMLNAKVDPHGPEPLVCNSYGTRLDCSNLGGIVCTALNSTNNWGGHSRASVAAAAIYLNDTALLTKVVNAEKAFIGLPVANTLSCNDTTWHADASNKAGENRKGTTRNGINISGVIPEDWRRADYNFTWPPTKTGYMWEGMQGYVAAAAILHRAGLVPFSSGDNALVRAMDILYARGEAANNSGGFSYPAEGDDTWIPWVVNYYAGTSYPTGATTAGKGMGWTDWTHQR